jgi:putative hydrolase of the HAD superfamily
MITTVIFDLDDTLYDEIDYCRSGFATVAEFLTDQLDEQSAEHIFGIIWKNFAEGNHTKTFNATLDELGIVYDDKLISDMVRVYRNQLPNIKLPPDSSDVLYRLSSRYIMGLLTDGFLPAQQLKVQALGIEKYFKCIIYTEELGRSYWKPSTRGFEKILHNLNTKPENAVYIADNEKKDFIAPNKLGLVTIQLNRPAGIHRNTSGHLNAPAQHKIDQISRLPALLDAL